MVIIILHTTQSFVFKKPQSTSPIILQIHRAHISWERKSLVIKTQPPMACLFKAKLNGAEWEEGGIAPDPRSFFWPCGSLLYPFPHVYAAWGPGWNNEWLWWGARTAGNKNRLQKYHGLQQMFKTRGNSSRCRTKREWELGLLAEGLAVNPGSIICCVCV